MVIRSLTELYKKHQTYVNGIKRLEQTLMHINSKDNVQTTLAALRRYYIWDNEVKKQIMSLQKNPLKRWIVRRILKR